MPFFLVFASMRSILPCLVCIFFLSNPILGYQNTKAIPSGTQGNISAEIAPASIQDIGSLWKLTELGGGIRWGIFLILALALLFILKKIIELSLDLVHSRKLESIDIENATISEVQQAAREGKPCFLGQIIGKQLDVFESTGKIELLHDEMNSFITQTQEHFTRFKNRMNFLSDTAGALGLLGTVWGMFQTFFNGNMDSRSILSGMGIALITTLLGLVVSIVINFASTEVSNFFNRRVERIFASADALRMRFFLSRQHDFDSSSSIMNAAPERELSPAELHLKPISKVKLNAQVGRHLARPLSVQTVSKSGLASAGIEVVFEVVDDGGFFVDKQTKYAVMSNKKGYAEVSFLLSGEVGNKKIHAYIKDHEESKIEFLVVGIPGPPAKLASASGNHQSSVVLEALPKPFVVSLTDAFGNAVQGNNVIFKITRGDGNFADPTVYSEDESKRLKVGFGKKRKAKEVVYEAQTDANGLAEASLFVGPLPGVNQVTATVKGLPKSPVVFEAMAQSEEVAA